MLAVLHPSVFCPRLFVSPRLLSGHSVGNVTFLKTGLSIQVELGSSRRHTQMVVCRGMKIWV